MMRLRDKECEELRRMARIDAAFKAADLDAWRGGRRPDSQWAHAARHRAVRVLLDAGANPHVRRIDDCETARAMELRAGLDELARLPEAHARELDAVEREWSREE